MATGIPVCATRTGGLQDIVTPETGLLFNRGDAADLARCLKHLLDHPEQRLAMGAAGRNRATEYFDWKHITRSHYLPLLAGL
jgi:glycosyltransferase involved in cell wall biosynthesis